MIPLFTPPPAVAQAQAQATQTQTPGAPPTSPSTTAQPANRQARGYGNTPLKQQSTDPNSNSPGRPPLGVKKSSSRVPPTPTDSSPTAMSPGFSGGRPGGNTDVSNFASTLGWLASLRR